MRYAVMYQSKSGNTRKLAKEIYGCIYSAEKELVDIDIMTGIPQADVYFIGFGVYNGTCSMEIIDCIEAIQEGYIALFTTCGFSATKEYKEKIENEMAVWISEDVEYLGMFLCQGSVPEEVREAILGKLGDKEDIVKLIFEFGSTHPDEIDMAAVVEFTIEIQNKAEW